MKSMRKIICSILMCMILFCTLCSICFADEIIEMNSEPNLKGENTSTIKLIETIIIGVVVVCVVAASAIVLMNSSKNGDIEVGAEGKVDNSNDNKEIEEKNDVETESKE